MVFNHFSGGIQRRLIEVGLAIAKLVALTTRKICQRKFATNFIAVCHIFLLKLKCIKHTHLNNKSL